MKNTDKDLYFVAVKLLLRDKNKLLITHDIFGAWDVPGGRLKPDEFSKPLESVIERKINEELGVNIKYSIGKPVVFFRVEREEAGLDGKLVRIFAIGYEGDYLGGEIKLGDHHDRAEWVDLNSLDPKEYFKDGWENGIQDYINKTVLSQKQT